MKISRPHPDLNDSDKRRFLTKLKVLGQDDCWEWTASVDGRGYGTFKLNGRYYIASRVAFALFYQQEATLFVLHRCDNPLCCNPKHLFLGTHQDNMADMSAKGRRPQAGDLHNGARLDSSQVRLMRQLFRTGKGSAELGRMFGVTRGHAWNIIQGKAWKSTLKNHEQDITNTKKS